MIARLSDSIKAVGEIKGIVLAMAGVHVFFLIAGYAAVALHFSWAVSMREEFLGSLRGFMPLEMIVANVHDGSLIVAMGITFVYNLTYGAFLSTTLTGLLFFLPALISSSRAFFIGLAFYDNIASPQHLVLIAGTVLLEFGAYSVSSALGTALGIEIVRRGEVRRALVRVLRGYMLVIALLLLGAVWEIAGIYLLLRWV
ncbi:hypothetical protein [Candidatus Pyrohabitans sp.]